MFYRDNAALAVHPSNPRMSSTHSTTHPGIFHDITQLHLSDDKMRWAVLGVLLIWGYEGCAANAAFSRQMLDKITSALCDFVC